MKVMEYGYVINKPVETVFNCLIDIETLHNKLNYFDKARVTSNGLGNEQVGKCYFIRNQHGDVISECTIELIKIDAPKLILLEYTYKIIEQNGRIEQGSSFMPWSSMNSITGFEGEGKKTRVTTLLYANGVDSFFKICATKVFGFISSFKQRRINRKVIQYMNQTL